MASEADPQGNTLSEANGPPLETSQAHEQQGQKTEEVDDVDAELEAMKSRLRQMEEEAEKLKDIQQDGGHPDMQNQGMQGPDVDSRSVYVGNVDYGATPEELQAHFQDCGTINRITILCNKFTGQPKGYAYIEFADEDAVKNAAILSDSLFRGRQLKVTPKRTNVPGLGNSDFARGRGRGRGGFRGRSRGGFRGRWPPY